MGLHKPPTIERKKRELFSIFVGCSVKPGGTTLQAMEGQFDACTEDLFNQTIKLEDMEKKAGNAEGQVGDLARRLLLLEENAVKAEFLTKFL
jgi:hypothetical protein